MPEDPNEWDFMHLYLTDDIINLTVTETNRYAEQFIRENQDSIKAHSSVKDWVPTNYSEMKTYLGMVILMGVVYKPRFAMYWSYDEIFETPIFPKLMTRNRFFLLSRFLHFADNNALDPRDPNRDRLFKIREISEMFKRNWKMVYTPGQNLCVDESLVLFKGRLAFKQYIKTKRSRFGIKFYTICTDTGISLDTLIYCGQLDQELQDVGGYLITERIPISLASDYFMEGRVLYIDNFYTTPRLCKYLLEHGMYTVGTVRTNRKFFPKELARADIPRGTPLFYVCEEQEVLAVKYRSHLDKSNGQPKVVHVLTTKHTNAVGPTKKKDKAGDVVKKPKCIIDYNHHMGGVDLVDQQLHHLNIIRKSYKWYKKIFLRLLSQSLLNSHKLYAFTGGKQDFLGFIKNLLNIMFTSAPKLSQNPRIVPHPDVHRLTGHNHYPERRPLPATSARKKAKYMVKFCRVCSARGKPNRTNWVCKNCPGKPGLHLEECFEIFHTKVDYSK